MVRLGFIWPHSLDFHVKENTTKNPHQPGLVVQKLDDFNGGSFNIKVMAFGVQGDMVNE